MPVTGQDLDGLAVEVQVLFPLGLRQSLTNWRVGIPTEIDDREVNIVQATTAKGGTVTLCFDQETGLLTRLVRFSTSPWDGSSPAWTTPISAMSQARRCRSSGR